MRNTNIDREWTFATGIFNGLDAAMGNGNNRIVNLPHDYMIESEVTKDAPAGASTGFYTAGVAHYTKKLNVPMEWKGQRVALRFDGVMMNATIDVNGCKAALQHYGYTPFEVDITQYLYWGRENRIAVTVNPSMQPNSRWYSGAGIFRSVELVHTPMVYIVNDGIFGYTKSIEYDENGNPVTAYLQTEVTVANDTNLNQIVEVEVYLTKDGSDEVVLSRKRKIQINPNKMESAMTTMTLDNPILWSAESPELYQLHAKVTTLGTYGAHFEEAEEKTVDETSTLFGIRTVTVDVKHGLRVNGKTVKLKGGCLHHDNGILGAVSLYDSEARKIKVMQEIGFNAIRTTHNPPSATFMEACDRLGMYVFSEAFDTWGIMKQPGDYNMFFETDWKKDLEAFVKRDRNHPSVLIWSTGNEITERGGLNNGYTLSTELSNYLRGMDVSRPISNGICSFWCGLDDELSGIQMAKLFGNNKEEIGSVQNVDFGTADTSWEEMTEAFTNGLDIVGYNYMEDKYPLDHEMFPERVILGSENYPKEIGKRWPMVESTDYVIGDFTWTAWDYIGEAGIGKAAFMEKDDPRLQMGPFSLMSHDSEFPWRTAFDADIDIIGNVQPQGIYRGIVWGNGDTAVFSYDPTTYDKVELTSMWGFASVVRNWNWKGSEGKKVKLVAFSAAEEVEVFVNGKSIGKKKQGEALATDDLPLSFVFETVYVPGEVLAVGYIKGQEVSRGVLCTTGQEASIDICPETASAKADGHSLCYIPVKVVDANGNVVTDNENQLTVSYEGDGELLGFGSGNHITAENYTSGSFKAYQGRALAVVRSPYEKGTAKLTVSTDGIEPKTIDITFE